MHFHLPQPLQDWRQFVDRLALTSDARLMSKILRSLVVVATFGSLMSSRPGMAHAGFHLLDLNKNISRMDGRFDCSRGPRCRFLPSHVGPFRIIHAVAEFGSGRLDHLSLQLKADQTSVRDWMTKHQGSPTSIHQRDGHASWVTTEGEEIDLFNTDGVSFLFLTFRDVPPLIVACENDEDVRWFDHEQVEQIAAQDLHRDDEERC